MSGYPNVKGALDASAMSVPVSLLNASKFSSASLICLASGDNVSNSFLISSAAVSEIPEFSNAFSSSSFNVSPKSPLGDDATRNV